MKCENCEHYIEPIIRPLTVTPGGCGRPIGTPCPAEAPDEWEPDNEWPEDDDDDDDDDDWE